MRSRRPGSRNCVTGASLGEVAGDSRPAPPVVTLRQGRRTVQVTPEAEWSARSRVIRSGVTGPRGACDPRPIPGPTPSHNVTGSALPMARHRDRHHYCPLPEPGRRRTPPTTAHANQDRTQDPSTPLNRENDFARHPAEPRGAQQSATHRIRVMLLAKGWLSLCPVAGCSSGRDLCSPWYPTQPQSEVARPIPMRRAGHRRPGLHPPRGPGRRPTT